MRPMLSMLIAALSAVLMATGASAGPVDASRAAAHSALQQVRDQTVKLQREHVLAARQAQPAREAAASVR